MINAKISNKLAGLYEDNTNTFCTCINFHLKGCLKVGQFEVVKSLLGCRCPHNCLLFEELCEGFGYDAITISKYICVLGSLFIPSIYTDCIPYISSLIGYIIEVTPPH